MITQKFFIKNRFGEKLEAVKEFPEREGPFPAVLMVPGLAMDFHEWGGSFDEISEKLVKNGFLAFRFSFAGCGKSDGDFKEMTISRQAKQVQDVLKYLQKEPLVDKNRIGILAQSMGGPSVIQALPLEISSLVLLSAVFNPGASLKKVIQERNIKIDPEKVTYVPRSEPPPRFAGWFLSKIRGETPHRPAKRDWCWGDGSLTELGPQIWEDFKKLDLKSKLEKHTSFPFLVLHGALDTKVPSHDAKQFFKFAQGKKELVIYPRGNHGLGDIPSALRKEVLEKIVEWFKNSLTKGKI